MAGAGLFKRDLLDNKGYKYIMLIVSAVLVILDVVLVSMIHSKCSSTAVTPSAPCNFSNDGTSGGKSGYEAATIISGVVAMVFALILAFKRSPLEVWFER